MPEPTRSVLEGASEASIDQVNQWMRQQPWYQQQMVAWGQDPGSPTLTKQQSQQILKMAQAQGVQVDQGDVEIDNHGNFNPKGNKLRNTLIVGGLAAAALTGGAALGAFGGGTAATGAAGTAAGLGGVEAGAAAGLSPFVASGALGMSALPALGAGGTAAGIAGLSGGIGEAIETMDVFGTDPGGGSIGSFLDKIGPGLRAAGQGIGAATTASGGNRLTQERIALDANAQNITGSNAFENAMMRRAATEADQRNQALKNVYRASYAKNPRVSPFNPAGGPKFSPEYLAALAALEGQGGAELGKAPQYNVSGMKPVTPYKPIDIRDVQGATGTKKGTLESIGDWLSPSLSTMGSIGSWF